MGSTLDAAARARPLDDDGVARAIGGAESRAIAAEMQRRAAT